MHSAEKAPLGPWETTQHQGFINDLIINGEAF